MNHIKSSFELTNNHFLPRYTHKTTKKRTRSVSDIAHKKKRDIKASRLQLEACVYYYRVSQYKTKHFNSWTPAIFKKYNICDDIIGHIFKFYINLDGEQDDLILSNKPILITFPLKNKKKINNTNLLYPNTDKILLYNHFTLKKNYIKRISYYIIGYLRRISYFTMLTSSEWDDILNELLNKQSDTYWIEITILVNIIKKKIFKKEKRNIFSNRDLTEELWSITHGIYVRFLYMS